MRRSGEKCYSVKHRELLTKLQWRNLGVRKVPVSTTKHSIKSTNQNFKSENLFFVLLMVRDLPLISNA